MSRDATLRSSDTDSATGIPAQKLPVWLLKESLLRQHTTYQNQRRTCSLSLLGREGPTVEVQAELSSQQDVLGPGISGIPDRDL
jgi:hypothetical protein